MIRIAATFKPCRTNVSVRTLSNSQKVFILAAGAGKQDATKVLKADKPCNFGQFRKEINMACLIGAKRRYLLITYLKKPKFG